jgi:hypothetical protein
MKKLWMILVLAGLTACESTISANTKEPKATPRTASAVYAAPAGKQAPVAKLEGAPYATGGGMWTFHHPPTAQLEKLYGFKPTQEWLDEVRLSSIRFPGGTGSFISPTGLVLTNHHVALDTLQKLSSEKQDYVKDGFYAASPESEVKTVDLSLDVMVSMEDVTARVTGAVKQGSTPQEEQKQREDAIKAIEKENNEKTKLKCTVYSLYTGGEYWVYRYKTYNDCRLVFAPEQQIAFYGGDPDNFTYPRYDLDFAVFRVYEGNKAASTPHYFKLNTAGSKDGELVFVPGNPGNTQRLLTMSQIEYMRDYGFPIRLKQLRSSLSALRKYSSLGEENARQAKAQIFGIENSIKAITGYHGGLLDPKIMARKMAEEADLRERIDKNAETKASVGDAFDVIAKSRAKMGENANRLAYSALAGTMASHALALVRYASEIEKPNADRLIEYSDARLPGLKKRLEAPVPIYAALEEAQLTAVLRDAKEMNSNDDPFVQAALGGKDPAEVASKAVRESKLNDAAFRMQLFEGGKKAIDASLDPMLELARRVDKILRDNTKWRENEIDAVERNPANKIAKARFAAYGHTVPPDANFTLRLSPGVVKGYEEDTTLVPYKTTFYGLYERFHAFDGKEPYQLPGRYVERMQRLPLSTPLNFVCTCDIIGGNSGSAVINKNRELVGLIFDGNIQSLPGNFVYDDVDQRAVSVHSAAIIETLRSLYDATALANEILGDAN